LVGGFSPDWDRLPEAHVGAKATDLTDPRQSPIRVKRG
jgi:hypothetical protein